MSQQTNQAPPTVSELVTRIARGRTQLDEWTAKLNDAYMTARGKDGWAIKDHFAHLAAWEAGTAALLRGESRYAAMGVDMTNLASSDFEAINQQIYARHQDKSFDDVKRFFQTAHAELLSQIAKMADADLLKPYSHFQPNEQRDDSGNPILGWIAGNTYGHYEEHIEWIRENYGL